MRIERDTGGPPRPDAAPGVETQLVGSRVNTPALIGIMAGVLALGIVVLTLAARILGSRAPETGLYVRLFGSSGVSLVFAGMSWPFKRGRPRLGSRQPRIALATAILAFAAASLTVWAT